MTPPSKDPEAPSPELVAWGNNLDTSKRVFAQDVMNTSEESVQRKARSEVVLQREGVPFIQHLPALGPVASMRFRTTMKVATRMVCVNFAAIYAEEPDRELLERLIEEWGIGDFFTDQERAFLATKEPSSGARAKFGWRYECVWLFLWALGLIEEIGRPDKIVDVGPMAAKMIAWGPDGIVGKSHLRDPAEIADLLDLTYRYHWACTNARIKGLPSPAGLDPGVVYERHYALNWLTGYGDQDWDGVRTDT